MVLAEHLCSFQFFTIVNLKYWSICLAHKTCSVSLVVSLNSGANALPETLFSSEILTKRENK